MDKKIPQEVGFIRGTALHDVARQDTGGHQQISGVLSIPSHLITTFRPSIL